MSVEIAMQWNASYTESVHTFANVINTAEGGTHEEGFRAALTSVVNKYARDQKLLKEKDDNLTGEDVREGLTAIVSIKLAEPQFEGQTKTKLGNTEAKSFVQKVANDHLRDWFDRNPGEAKDIINKASQAARARIAARQARDLTRRKSADGEQRAAGQAGRLPVHRPGASPRSTWSRETRRAARPRAAGTRKFQAILPIRGKIINVEKSRIDRVLKNNEVQSMITALGAGIHDEFDIDQAPLPQDHPDGGRRRGRAAHQDAAAHAALPVHEAADRGRLRLPRAAAAVQDQVGRARRRRPTTRSPTPSWPGSSRRASRPGAGTRGRGTACSGSRASAR